MQLHNDSSESTDDDLQLSHLAVKEMWELSEKELLILLQNAIFF